MIINGLKIETEKVESQNLKKGDDFIYEGKAYRVFKNFGSAQWPGKTLVYIGLHTKFHFPVGMELKLVKSFSL